MNALSAAWTIALKDARSFARDRMGLILGFLLPIALVTVFGFIMRYAFGGSEGTPKVELWVCDEDQSGASQKLFSALRDSEMLRVRPRVDDPPQSSEALRQRLADGEAHHVLVIPKGYDAALGGETLPRLQLYRDPGRAMEDRIVSISLLQALTATSDGRFWSAALGDVFRRSGFSDNQAREIVGAGRELEDLIAEFSRDVEKGDVAQDAPQEEGPKPEALQGMSSDFFSYMTPVDRHDVAPPARPKALSYQLAQSVCGMTVMMLMFGLTAASGTLLRERESGVLRRLMASAIPRLSIFWGKFLFTLLLGIVNLAVLFTYGEMVFRIGAFRDPVSLAIISLVWALAATSFGLLIASWANTSRQAEGLSTVFILVMAALGGCWFPLQIMDLPRPAELLTQAMPTYWAMTAYQQLFWNGFAWHHPQVLRSLGVLLAVSAVALSAAILFFRKRYIAG